MYLVTHTPVISDSPYVVIIIFPLSSLQHGGRRGPAVRAPEMDPLLRERHVDHFPGGFVRVRSDPLRI